MILLTLPAQFPTGPRGINGVALIVSWTVGEVGDLLRVGLSVRPRAERIDAISLKEPGTDVFSLPINWGRLPFQAVQDYERD